jgi:hypothetical protein
VTNHTELRSLLGQVRRRWFALAALGTVGRATGAAALPLGACALGVWLFRPSGVVLVAVVSAALLGAAAAALAAFLRMPRRPDDGQVARFVEERAETTGPALSDALVSAVQVEAAPDRHPPAFAQLIVAGAVRKLQEIEPTAVIPTEAMRRALLQCLAGLGILAVAAVFVAPPFQRAAAVAWIGLFPGSIRIQVLTGDVRVPAGRPLRIAATVQGRGAELLGIAPTLVVSADGQQRSVEMSRSGNGFAHAFDSVDRTFQYHVAAGTASSAPYTVTAIFPARVTRIDVRYEYPGFAALPPREDEDSGDVYAPAGTRVRLLIQTDKPIASGALALTSGGRVDLAGTGDAAASADLVLTRDDSYRVRMIDVDGLQSTGDLEYFLRVMDDRPPTVHIVRPAGDQGITPLEEVAIEARADDDYGVARFDLVYTVAGRPPRRVPFTRQSGPGTARIGNHLLAVEELKVEPGDVITYYAQARDVARGKPASEARSDIFFLEVKPFNEEFVAAQSQAMGGGAAGAQIDGLVAAQKEIINATWNLERRSGAGRSPEDIRAVGEAQAELKARVEQLLAAGRRGSRGFFPQQIVRPPRTEGRGGSPDPVAAAVDAMTRALEQLKQERTADALTHEMAALQGLLRAQAEVRRREVMQQSASAAGQGGTSRTDRDLSALFDRELQRQQRTNYETPRQSTETPKRESQDDDAAARVRELARRQEELARSQRDLAGEKMTPEEMKRQLDRLSREQQQLRRELDQLQQQRQGVQASDAAGLRRAAEDMRRAATEMQRQNAGGAAASGEKAAEALRDTERQIRGGSPGARQRAAGELQLEAQQIADAQRRVASEVARLGKDSQGAADALRRLAAEKNKLADRVDGLERAARDLERNTPGAEGTRFRETAQHIQGQQIGGRMRQSAKDLQHPQASGGSAAGSKTLQTEQELARALDGVVDRLGGKAQGDARRLTDALDRARDIRNRLDRLQADVRDAEEAARGAAPAGAPAARGRDGQGRRSGADGSAQSRLQSAREAYARELERSREELGRLSQGGEGGATPEQHEFSRSAPGTEAFKQDFSGWERLRKDIDSRLERYEAAVSSRLARKDGADGLSAGGSERVPDGYRDSVSRYFESLAKVKK